MTRLSSYRDFDWVLLGFVLLLSIISVLEIKSATLHTKFHGFEQKQVVFLLTAGADRKGEAAWTTPNPTAAGRCWTSCDLNTLRGERDGTKLWRLGTRGVASSDCGAADFVASTTSMI